MTAYPGQTRTTLGQLCAALWDSQSRLDVIQPGFEPGTVVMPLALRYSALDHCATREPTYCPRLFFNRVACLLLCPVRRTTYSPIYSLMANL
jgi:hypothetical protein